VSDFLASKFARSSQSLVRIVIGSLFACHGTASLFGLFGAAVGTHGGTVPFGAWPGWWAAVIQLIGGVLVMLGLFTRAAALICSGSMAYAYFTVHQPHALMPIENGGELAALYCWIFLLIAAFGPGPWALDRAFGAKSVPQSVAPVGAAKTTVTV
jgi:putative oxidoreductase